MSEPGLALTFTTIAAAERTYAAEALACATREDQANPDAAGLFRAIATGHLEQAIRYGMIAAEYE